KGAPTWELNRGAAGIAPVSLSGGKKVESFGLLVQRWGALLLAVVCVLAAAGLLYDRQYRDTDPIKLGAIAQAQWGWLAVGGAGLSALGAFRIATARAGEHKAAVLDLLLPLSVMLLLVGLIWGLWADDIYYPLRDLTFTVFGKPEAYKDQVKRVGMSLGMLSFGLPAVLCYTFVDRPFRFGMAAAGLCLG